MIPLASILANSLRIRRRVVRILGTRFEPKVSIGGAREAKAQHVTPCDQSKVADFVQGGRYM